MDNFFNNAYDYNAFKRALKITDGETVVINVLASDESLKPAPSTKQNNKPRKSMSSKFEPSPFGKFFSSKPSGPVDMNDFSSWKNKNYRRTEDNVQEDEEDPSSLFSLSSYMQDKSQDTFNELDQARSDVQKPIMQLDSDDPTLQKFSLDGYMHKLEESILAKDKFTENEDLLEPIMSDDDYYSDGSSSVTSINKQQDEDFFGGNGDIERFAFDESVSGSRYSMDSAELDKVKDRLAKLEREANNIKEKPNEKVITGDELTEKAEKDDFDDLMIKKTDTIVSSDSADSKRGRRLNEVVMHTSDAQSQAPTAKKPIFFSSDDLDAATETEEEDESKTEEPEEMGQRGSDVLTREDFRDMTNEFMSKFSEMLGKSNQPEETEEYAQQDIDYDDQLEEYRSNQEELEMKINELVESKNRTERETQEKLKEIEQERSRIDEEYQQRLKDMEESYSKKYEEFKQKMYLDKLNSEKKEKEENISKLKKEQVQNGKLNNNQVGAILKKELKSHFNISNLESEKKLLEVSSEIASIDDLSDLESSENKNQQKITRQQSPVVVVREKTKVVEAPAPVVVAPKKPSKPRTKRKPKRRIDSDIIGGISY